MFLRATTCKKDGKEHRYWSVVENRRVARGRVVQRYVLYLGQINSSREFAWRKSIEELDEHTHAPRTLALFPEVTAKDCRAMIRHTRRQLKAPAPGLTARSALEKFAPVQRSMFTCRPPMNANCC